MPIIYLSLKLIIFIHSYHYLYVYLLRSSMHFFGTFEGYPTIVPRASRTLTAPIGAFLLYMYMYEYINIYMHVYVIIHLNIYIYVC